MKLEDIKRLIKKEFDEISAAFFSNSLNIQYIEGTNRIFGEGGSMFGANIVKYSETNFEYLYYYLKYLCLNVNILNLKPLEKDYKKLKVTKDLLSLDFIKQADILKNIDKETLFVELNFVANLFAFFHECGHINQTIDPDEETIDTNHFAEFNSDYYALSNILKYYYTLRKKYTEVYYRKALSFENEHNFIRCIIVISLTIIFLECLANTEIGDTSTHPSIKKRFCYLLYQLQIQLETNFDFLFVNDKLSDFLVDIFNTLYYIEIKLLEKDFIIFNDLLHYCISCVEDVKNAMMQSKKFNSFND